MHRTRTLLLASLALLPALPACRSAGPSAIRAGRSDYNMAIQETGNEQLLLNIVRLRYRDTPFFLEVASVTTNFTFTATGSANATVQRGADPVGLGASLAYTEDPTVTYTPLQGDRFVRQMMSPVDLGVVALLYHSGWSIERILRVCAQSLGGLPNAPSASGPTPAHVPRYRRFLEATEILRRLQVEGNLLLGFRPDGERLLEIRFVGPAADSQELARLVALLGLPDGTTRFTLGPAAAEADVAHAELSLRSLMATLFYVSQAVEVPPEDERAGRATVTRGPDGARFDWSELFGDLIRIAPCPGRPDDAAVSARYRGTWFRIADDDLGSKSTFALLTQLFALAAGEVRSVVPVLTIPVAG